MTRKDKEVKTKIELSLEEQLAKKREQDRKEFEQGYEKLCKDKGFRFDAVIEVSMVKGIKGGLNIISTR